MADRVGQQLDKYRLIRLLGQGGYGDVYLGEHIYLETLAAIKVLNTQVRGDDVEQFLAEARTLAHLKHPNIVRVLDSGIEDVVPYLVMDYAPKGTLRTRHPKGSRVSLADILSYVKQLAPALQYAHNQRLIHRDVKPGNMLIGANDEILLSDFGIAVVAHTTGSRSLQDVAGTALYMSPEQLEGKASPASDQYALAVVVYEWLCGEPPFQGSPMELAMRHLTSTPTPPHQLFPDIVPAVEMVILTALAKDPQLRFASVQAFANAFAQACQPSLPTGSLLRDVQHPSGLTERSFYSATTEPESLIAPAAPESISSIPTAPLPSVSPQEANIPTFISPSRGTQVPPPPTGTWQGGAGSPLEKCPFCLAATRPGDNFCLNCGNRLVASPVPSDWGASLLGSVVMPTIVPSSEERKGGENTFATVADASIFPPSFPTETGTAPTALLPPTLPSVSTPPVSPAKNVELLKKQWQEKGDVYYKMGQYTDALRAYEQVIQLDTQDAHAYFYKGNVLQSLGQYEASLAAYNDSVRFGLDNAAVWSALGEVLLKLKRYPQSLDAYDHALALTPNDVGVWITKGNILFRKLKLYEEALIAYERVLELNPQNATIWIVKGEVLYRLESYESALEAYNHASHFFHRRSSVWTSKGEVLYKLKRYEEALAMYEHARFLKPNDVSIVNKCELLRDLLRHQEELRRREEERLLQEELRRREEELRQQEKERLRQEALQRQEEERLRQEELQRQKKKSGAFQTIPPAPDSGHNATRTSAENKASPSQFEVYMIYSKADAQWVEKLAERLEDERHIKVWLDEWMAIPGESEQHTRAQGINQAKCFAVCIGEQTSSEWFKREIQLALNRQQDNKALRVIPVLLPNAREINIDEFVELNNAVDFGVADQEYAFHRLVSGIRGVAPGRWPPERTMAPDKTITMVRDMLVDLQGLPVDKDVAKQMQQTVLEKVWLPNWLMQLKESTYE